VELLLVIVIIKPDDPHLIINIYLTKNKSNTYLIMVFYSVNCCKLFTFEQPFTSCSSLVAGAAAAV